MESIGVSGERWREGWSQRDVVLSCHITVKIQSNTPPPYRRSRDWQNNEGIGKRWFKRESYITKKKQIWDLKISSVIGGEAVNRLCVIKVIQYIFICYSSNRVIGSST